MELSGGERILDYGCGDGRLLTELSRLPSAPQSVGLEPYLSTTALQPGIPVYPTFEAVLEHYPAGAFDRVLCFEVLEHFNPTAQRIIIQNLYTALHPEGRAVVSVPVELGPPALVKNAFRRRLAREFPHVYTLKNIAQSALFQPPQALRKAEGFLQHVGFDFRLLEPIFGDYFEIERRVWSPIWWLPYWLNSQVFYVLRKKTDRAQ